MKKRINLVTLRIVHIGGKYPKGAFEGVFYSADGKTKTKQCALHAHEVDIAYQTVDLWCEDIAKEFDIPYDKETQANLIKMIEGGTREAKPTDGITTGVNRSILSSQKYLKAEINRAFDAMGYERIKEVLKIGNLHLDSLERDRHNRIRNLGKAKTNMAKSMYQSYLDTGVDMSEFCNDDEIVKEFNSYRLESAKLL